MIVALIIALFALLWLFMIMPRLRRPAAVKQLTQYHYAHRGLHNIERGVPENSLPAFRLAVEQGYGIELDVHLSKDGKLVVEHDDTLKRTCGTDRRIEDSRWEELKDLRLEGTEERLPLLEDVLALVAGKIPLLIEAKVVGGNWNTLGTAIQKAMEGYQGLWCVESFDPRQILWFRRHAPEVVRGQLAGNVRKEGSNVSYVIGFVLENLLVNVLSRPDFVAYNYESYRNLSFKLCRALFHPPVFFWTLRTPEAMALAEDKNTTPIFEKK